MNSQSGNSYLNSQMRFKIYKNTYIEIIRDIKRHETARQREYKTAMYSVSRTL